MYQIVSAITILAVTAECDLMWSWCEAPRWKVAANVLTDMVVPWFQTIAQLGPRALGWFVQRMRPSAYISTRYWDASPKSTRELGSYAALARLLIGNFRKNITNTIQYCIWFCKVDAFLFLEMTQAAHIMFGYAGVCRPRLAEVSLSNHRHGAAVDFTDTDLQRGHLWLSEFIICTICTMFRYVLHRYM